MRQSQSCLTWRCTYSILLKCNIFFQKVISFPSFKRNRVRLFARLSSWSRARQRGTRYILSSVLDCDNLKGASKRSSLNRPLSISRRIFFSFLYIPLAVFFFSRFKRSTYSSFPCNTLSYNYVHNFLLKKQSLPSYILFTLHSFHFRKLSIICAPFSAYASASTLTG